MKKIEPLLSPPPEDVDKVTRTAFELLPGIDELDNIEIEYKDLKVKLKAKRIKE